MDVRIEDVGPLPLIFTVGLGPYAITAPKAWEALFSELQKQDQIHPKQMIGFGMDDPTITPAPLTRYVAATTFDGDYKETPESKLHKMEIKAGKYAIYTMKGAYKNMPDVFAKLRTEWLPNSNEDLDCTRPWLEIYLNNPFEVPEEEYLTDLHIPLK